MERFANLYSALDQTGSTNEKVAAMVDYFSRARPADAAWAIYFLSGHKPRQIIPTRKLIAWALEAAAIPEWLFDESYEAVGDLAETITLVLPESRISTDLSLSHWVEQRTLPLRNAIEAEQHDAVIAAWQELTTAQCFVWNKLITGSFRVGVSQQLVMRALAKVSGIDAKIIAHRLMGNWLPSAQFYEELVSPDTLSSSLSHPYPFFLAHPLEEPETLGDVEDWLAEFKWDGIRAQMIRRGGQSFIWSRGEELITERFPELAAFANTLPDGTVIDGEILPWKDNAVMPFAQLQRRIGRKTIGKKILSDVPVIMMAFDLLEDQGVDIRSMPLQQRRARLEQLIGSGSEKSLKISERVNADSWQQLAIERESSRSRFVEGVMLKRLNSAYGTGRTRGDWWKWKIAPFTIDAVMIYAQTGHGRRASLYTDYTFGVWHEGALVPFAKAYSGLTDQEIREVDNFIRRNTLERFGPVRSVKPLMVFELAFEAIQRSTRHKSGVAVRFPRILRIRSDKTPQQADSLEAIWRLLERKSDAEQEGVPCVGA